MGFSIKLKYKTYFYLFYFQLYYYITDVNIMCYNSTVSLNVFVVMVISTIYLFYRNYSNDKFFATVFISAGLMQLLEYFMWKDQSCGSMNHTATVLAFILLLIQPLGLLLGAYYFGELVFNIKKLLPIILIYGTLIGIIGIKWIDYASNHKLCSRPNGKHLDWDFSNLLTSNIMKVFWVMYYLLILILVATRHWYLGAIVGILLVGTLLFSVFYVKNTAWKSFWCVTVNLIPIIYILLTTRFR